MFTLRFVFAVLLATAVSAVIGTIKERQNLGSLNCNLARLRIVGALGDTETAIGEIEDPATQEAAAAGLTQAQGGIQQIAQAIAAGEAPPEDGRAQVEAGLTAVGDALGAGDGEDQAVADAQESLEEAAQAGKDVVANC